MFKQILIMSIIYVFTSCGQNKEVKVEAKDYKRVNKENLKKIESIQSKDKLKIAMLSNIIDDLTGVESSIDYINNMNYDFVIVNGNISNNGFRYEFEEAISILNRLNIPYLTVTGDKDLSSGGLDLYRKMFGSENYTLSINNKVFIFFNNNNWETQMKAPNVSWIESQLEEHKGSEIYMISNCSFKNLTRFSDSQIEQFELMIRKYKVKYVLSNSNDTKNLNDFEELAVESITSGNILELNIRDTKSSHKYVNFKEYE